MTYAQLLDWLFGRVSPAVPVAPTAPAPPEPSERDILAAFKPWTLACAVGAENGSIGTSMGFETWLRISQENWIDEVSAKSLARPPAVADVLRRYVHEHRAEPYTAVLRNEERKRGLREACVLGPGESMQISATWESGE